MGTADPFALDRTVTYRQPIAPVDEMILLSGASSGAVPMALFELNLAGWLDRPAGNRVSLRPA